MNQQTYSPDLDGPRLENLRIKVRDFLMATGDWYSLHELQANCGGSEAGISARLRELRRLYQYPIEKKRVGESGLWVYRLNRTEVNGQYLLPGCAA